MGIISNTFTWWNGQTFGTWLAAWRGGTKVGEDELGNRYYEVKQGGGRPPRRWVLYKGSNDASRVSPEWHSWLHHMIEGLPDQALPPVRQWERPAAPNMTGTTLAYRPPGAFGDGAHRAKSTGDYEAWTPGD